MSPPPTTSSRSPGRSAATRPNASASSGKPLRGSSSRPTKATVPCSPRHSSRGAAARTRSTYTPFGITTGSPPMWLTSMSRAYSETAIRAVIFSSDGRRIVADADIARERTLEVWNVATTGHSAAQSASSEMLGVAGSCRCSTSKLALRAASAGPGPPTTGPKETPGDRPVVGHRHRSARRSTTYGGRSAVLARGQHRHVVAAGDQRLREVLARGSARRPGRRTSRGRRCRSSSRRRPAPGRGPRRRPAASCASPAGPRRSPR